MTRNIIMEANLQHLTYLLRKRATVTRADASEILGIHKREVQNVIAGLQKGGWDIISDSRGYWMPSDVKDLPRIVKAARTRHRHALGELKDASRFLKIAKRIKREGQEELFG